MVATLHEMRPKIPLLQLFDKWRGQFYSMDVDELLTLDASAQSIGVKESTISQPDVGQGLFASRTIETCEMAGYHYGSLF